jgi:hypothetical protein
MNDIGDPHDQEEKAEVKLYVLWCEGRFEELRRAGLLDGPSLLTATGWHGYRKLLASGFVPNGNKVIWTFRSDERVPPELVEKLATLMLGAER